MTPEDIVSTFDPHDATVLERYRAKAITAILAWAEEERARKDAAVDAARQRAEGGAVPHIGDWKSAYHGGAEDAYRRAARILLTLSWQVEQP